MEQLDIELAKKQKVAQEIREEKKIQQILNKELEELGIKPVISQKHQKLMSNLTQNLEQPKMIKQMLEP